ncbi:hypothetical protein [Micromonospora sp. NPDC049301]|uniref:DUF433 domain-containing protein n=1 Tax=Micromonospora sp. NPDC049301 TaxID=3155723 RepID=UPI0034217EC0
MVTVLHAEMFSEAEAARLLDLPQSTLHYWLEGGTRRGVKYAPILRSEPQGGRAVTWAEFVEAGLLRQYRRRDRVPMKELRAFIDKLRTELGVPYPLADRRPYAVNKELVHQAQISAGLAPEWHMVAEVSGQLLLTGPSEQFFDRVDWEGDLAAGWRPTADEKSTVRIRPDTRFGRPAVKGISTATIWEQADSGEDVEYLAKLFHLTVPDVRWALAYEESRRASSSNRAA